MALADLLKDAVKDAIGATIAADIQDIVAKETRRALREHEDEMTALVRASVAAAIKEMLDGAGP